MRYAFALGAFFLAVPGCDGQDTLRVEPRSASMFGDIDVAITGNVESVGAIRSVTVGGVHALDLRASPHGVIVHIQGAPNAGPAEIVVTGERGELRNRTAFSFDAPAVPTKWMAFGASLTQGAQSGGLDAHAQLAGYASQIARSAGVFLAPPLVVDGLLPPLAPSAFVTDCSRKPDTGLLIASLFARITDPETHATDLGRGRSDPSLETHNPAISGSKLSDVIDGTIGANHLIERLAELPDGDPQRIWAPTTHPQLDRVRAFDPDIGFSGDLLANDATPAVTQDDDLHPETMTDPALMESEIETIVSTLGALHGQYFLANLLDVTLLPAVSDLRKRRIDGGLDTNESFEAKLGVIRAKVSATNDALARSASRFPNIHVLDFAGETKSVLTDGVTIEGVHLAPAKFGGLLSLDHMHFSDTGYAVMANFFIRAINERLGTHVAEIDLAKTLRSDPFSPDNLRAHGVQCR